MGEEGTCILWNEITMVLTLMYSVLGYPVFLQFACVRLGGFTGYSSNLHSIDEWFTKIYVT